MAEWPPAQEGKALMPLPPRPGWDGIGVQHSPGGGQAIPEGRSPSARPLPSRGDARFSFTILETEWRP